MVVDDAVCRFARLSRKHAIPARNWLSTGVLTAIGALAAVALAAAQGCVPYPTETITVTEPVPPVVAPASSGPIAFDSADGRTSLSGQLSFPRGQPPFPGIVVLHSNLCAAGLPEWAPAALTTWGYATLAVDSYAARAMSAQACLDFGALQASDEIGDAYGALLAMQSNAAIDRNRIALVGISDGATAALVADTAQARAAYLRPGDAGFRAVFAISPFCRFQFTSGSPQLYSPLRIFAGGRDEIAPAASCVALARAFNLAGGDADTIVYSRAEHGFDSGAAGAASAAAFQMEIANLSRCTIRVTSVADRIDPSAVQNCMGRSGHVASDPGFAAELQIALKAELRTLMTPPFSSVGHSR